MRCDAVKHCRQLSYNSVSDDNWFSSDKKYSADDKKSGKA